MRPLPKLSHTLVSSVSDWANFHHTIVHRSVPCYLTPGASGIPPQGAALTPDLNAILGYCLQDPPERLCIIGSRWSLSNILDPGAVLLDAGAWNQIARVASEWVTPQYGRGGVPVIVQGGTTIGALNRVLGKAGLALQTSGAGDGHRIAGCIATGTHGSHPKVGAVHDTVLAVLLVTAPDHAVLVQPSTRYFAPELTQWFQQQTTFKTVEDKLDDELFAAAQVSLGGLGFVHSVIVETVPLYELVGASIERPLWDPAIWDAMASLDPTALGSIHSPDFFTVVFSPFAQSNDFGSFTTWLTKRPAQHSYAAPGPVRARIASDLSQLLSKLVPLADISGVAGAFLGHVIAAQTSAQYRGGPIGPSFPGSVFGPTSLPEGNGRSVELVVDHQYTRPAVKTVLDTLRSEGQAGRHLLGGVSVRYAPRSSALLGMNIHAMNAYIEFPGIGSPDTDAIHRAVFDALRAAAIPFTCHWGQEYKHGMDSASIRRYFGDRVDRWKAARQVLLPSSEQRAVFTNPLIEQLGLS